MSFYSQIWEEILLTVLRRSHAVGSHSRKKGFSMSLVPEIMFFFTIRKREREGKYSSQLFLLSTLIEFSRD
jgi:hypothetical protein